MQKSLTLQERRALKAKQQNEWRERIIQYTPFSHKGIDIESNNAPYFIAEETTPDKIRMSNVMVSDYSLSETINEQEEANDGWGSSDSAPRDENVMNSSDSPRTPRSKRELSFSSENEELSLHFTNSDLLNVSNDSSNSSSIGSTVGSSKIEEWRNKRKNMNSKKKNQQKEIEKIIEQEDEHTHVLCTEVEELVKNITHGILTDKMKSNATLGSPSNPSSVLSNNDELNISADVIPSPSEKAALNFEPNSTMDALLIDNSIALTDVPVASNIENDNTSINNVSKTNEITQHQAQLPHVEQQAESTAEPKSQTPTTQPQQSLSSRDNSPNKARRLSTAILRESPVKRGFNKQIRFNMMLVGEQGCGKSTFLKSFVDPLDVPTDSLLYMSVAKELAVDKTEISSTSSLGCSNPENDFTALGHFEWMSNDNNKIVFSALESKQFGNAMIDNKINISNIKSMIKSAHENHSKLLNITNITEQEMLDADERVHCLFYFITPHRMKEIDYEFIKEISPYVPIVPIVSKADMMTIDERKKLLKQIQTNFSNIIQEHTHKSCIFDFFNEDASQQLPNKRDSSETMAINENNIFMTICGEREYPWGIKFDDNNKFSDIRRLQKLLLASEKCLNNVINAVQNITIPAGGGIESAASSPSSKLSVDPHKYDPDTNPSTAESSPAYLVGGSGSGSGSIELQGQSTNIDKGKVRRNSFTLIANYITGKQYENSTELQSTETNHVDHNSNNLSHHKAVTVYPISFSTSEKQEAVASVKRKSFFSFKGFRRS